MQEVAAPSGDPPNPDLPLQERRLAPLSQPYGARASLPFPGAASAMLFHGHVWPALFFLLVRWRPPCDVNGRNGELLRSSPASDTCSSDVTLLTTSLGGCIGRWRVGPLAQALSRQQGDLTSDRVHGKARVRPVRP